MKRRLGKFGGYFLSTLLTSAASFFSVPLLVRGLGSEQFAKWSLLEPVLSIVSQVLLLGTNYGIVKLINNDSLPPSFAFKKMLVASIPVTLVASVLLFLFVPCYLDYSLSECIWFVLLIVAEAIFLLLVAAFRAGSCVDGFTASSVSKAALYLLLLTLSVFTGVVTVNTALQNVELRLVVAALGIVFGLAVAFSNKNRPFTAGSANMSAQCRLYPEAVKYGFPMLITGLLTMVIDFADRFILKAFFDYNLLAQYVIYVKIAAFLGPVAIVPFGLWWPTERFRRLQDADGGRLFFQSITIIVLTAFLMIGGSLWLMSAHILSWFAPKVVFAPNIILILIGSVVFMGMGAPMNIGLLNAGMTHYNIYGVLLGAVVHVAACFILIPPFGITGAAAATALSYFVYTVFLNFLSQRIHPVPFAYVKMFFLLVISTVALLWINWFVPGGEFLQSVGKTLMYCVFVAIFYIVSNGKLFFKFKKALCE